MKQDVRFPPSWLDINECEIENGETLCEQLCDNNVGSYSCDCNDGFYLNTTDNHSCLSKLCHYLQHSILPLCFLDVDECQSDMHNCSSSEHKVCVDTYGSYLCECERGYDNVTDICEGTRLMSQMFFEKINYTQMWMSAYTSGCITAPTSVSIQLDLIIVLVNSGILLRLMERLVRVRSANFTQYHVSGSS